jgi:fucose 4-O-acetylase-like acetyltransferase
VNSTIVLGIAAIAFALVFRVQSQDLPETALRLPALLIWVVIALAAMMIVEELLKRRIARRTGVVAVDDDEPLPPVNWPVLGIFSLAILVYVALIAYLGYLITTPLFIIGGLLASKTLSPAKAVLVGAIATALVWAIFIWALGLPIPLLPSLS